jgi:hypothetical protein
MRGDSRGGRGRGGRRALPFVTCAARRRQCRAAAYFFYYSSSCIRYRLD